MECMIWSLYYTFPSCLQHLEIFSEILVMPVKRQCNLQFHGHHSYFRKYFKILLAVTVEGHIYCSNNKGKNEFQKYKK